MSKKLAIILAINNIVLAWAIVWLNSGQVTLQARASFLIVYIRNVADLASRAMVSAQENEFYIYQLIQYITSQ